MTEQILHFEDLQRLCRPRGPLPRPATVRRWAERQKISCKYDGSGGIWTTLDALNAALKLGGHAPAAKPEDLI
jgi:hypothetical protein